MTKKEKIIWILAYTLTAVLTLLPFFKVGFTTADDFQYYLIAQQNLGTWFADAKAYAHDTGRFYFLITKYFYYIPYLFDSFIWTKFVQFTTLIASYAFFSYLIARIFKSERTGALTLLFLIWNTALGAGMHYPTSAYPFYFSFSFIIFLLGILFFIKYTETKKYKFVWISAGIFFLSYLFYENYLLFALFFCCYILIRNWKESGLKTLFKSKAFYKEIIPFALSLFVYATIYIAYKQHVATDNMYGGAAIANTFSLSNFFTILNKCTLYVVPGRVHYLAYKHNYLISNSLNITGFHNNLIFVLTHASTAAYINAFLQCLILWFITQSLDTEKISWKQIIIGSCTALAVAYLSHTLIAITDKYNSDWYYWIQAYVTTLYSLFGIILIIALGIIALFKSSKNKIKRLIFSILSCCLLFIFSIDNYTTNEYLGREWQKSQNRIKVLELMAEENYFATIPEESILYTESVHNTSKVGLMICNGTRDFENFIEWKSKRSYLFATNEYELHQLAKEHPQNAIYYIQATESIKNCELMVAFSRSTRCDTLDVRYSLADHSDIFYYSPTKDFTMFYRTNAQTDSTHTYGINIISENKHKKLTHISIENTGLDPFGFCISNMTISTKDTIRL